MKKIEDADVQLAEKSPLTRQQSVEIIKMLKYESELNAILNQVVSFNPNETYYERLKLFISSGMKLI